MSDAATPPPAPERLTMVQVPAYVQERHGFTVTKKTVYNWLTKGIRKETLQYVNVPNPEPTHKYPVIKVTTKKWIDEFFTRSGVRTSASA